MGTAEAVSERSHERRLPVAQEAHRELNSVRKTPFGKGRGCSVSSSLRAQWRSIVETRCSKDQLQLTAASRSESAGFSIVCSGDE